MSVATLPSGYRGGASPRRRAAALALTAALVALVLAMLLALGAVPGLPGTREPAFPVIFQPLPPAQKRTAPKASTQAKQDAHAEAGAAPPSPVPPTPHVAPPPPSPVPRPAPTLPGIIALNHDAFASSDIGTLPSHAGEGQGDKGPGKDSVAPYGPGSGPGGAPSYPVRWYREPTRAEMATYEPHSLPQSGWAEVQCRMVEHYHVENCRQAGESPVGSGLSRALRLASWQFLVVPPRRDGKPMIGAWVTVHYEWRAAAPGDGAERGTGPGGGPGHPPPDDDAR